MTAYVKPSHYKIAGTEIDIGRAIEHLPFWVANSIKYLYRVDGKNAPEENLDKAIECIQREKERRVRSDGISVRQEGPTFSDRTQQLYKDSPLTGHVRGKVGEFVKDISARGGGYVSTGEGYETYRVDSGYEV